MSSGGIDSLLDFLDPNVEDHLDLVSLAIDSFLLIFELRIINNMYPNDVINYSNLARILTIKSSTICLRLTIIVDNLFNMFLASRRIKSVESNISKYLHKVVDYD